MSELEAVERALWEVERMHSIAGVQMLPITERRLLALGQWYWPNPDPLKRTIFGIPVLLDPSMSPGEIKLIADCGCVVKLISLG